MLTWDILPVLKSTGACLTRGTKEEVLDKREEETSRCICSDVEVLILENGVKENDQTSKNQKTKKVFVLPRSLQMPHGLISDCFRDVSSRVKYI